MMMVYRDRQTRRPFHTRLFRGARALVQDRLLVNSISWVGARALSGLTRIGILLVIARIYGPQSFGQISFSLSLVEILRTFSEFGIDTISVRKFVQVSPEERTEMLARIAGAKIMLASLFYFIGGCILLLMTRNRLELYLGSELGLSLFSGLLGTLSSYLQSSFSMSKILKTAFWGSVASIAWALIALHYRAAPLVTLAALPLADCVNLILLWLKSRVPLRIKIGLQEPLSILTESLPVGIMAVFVILYFRIDNLLVFKFAGATGLGLYAACYRMIEPALMIPASFSGTTYSLLSAPRRQGSGAEEVLSMLLRTMWPAYVFVVFVSVSFLFFGKWFLQRLLPAYVLAYPILVVLAVALLIRSINVGLTTVLNSRARYSTLAKISGTVLLINVLIVFLMVPKWGAIGAAWAAVFTELINTVLQGRSVALLFSSSNQRRTLEGFTATD